MDAALAEQIIADFIERQFGGDYPDTFGRELATSAVEAERAAILTTGKHHNQFALNATFAVNKGGSLQSHIIETAFSQHRDLQSVADGVLASVVGVNALGRYEIRMARSFFAAPVSIAAE